VAHPRAVESISTKPRWGIWEIGGKTGWEQGDWAKKSGRFGSKTGAGRLGKYAGVPI
jgi:hypothetical protein